MNIDQLVGANVRNLRNKAGATQSDLAIALRRNGYDWHTTRISELENGKRGVDKHEMTLDLLAAMLTSKLRTVEVAHLGT